MDQIILWALTIGLYGIPSIIAFKRKHLYRGLIIVLNLLFGGIIVCWVGFLVWAIVGKVESKK